MSVVLSFKFRARSVGCISRFVACELSCWWRKSAQTVHHLARRFHAVFASTKCEHAGDSADINPGRYLGYATPSFAPVACLNLWSGKVTWGGLDALRFAPEARTRQILRSFIQQTTGDATPHVHFIRLDTLRCHVHFVCDRIYSVFRELYFLPACFNFLYSIFAFVE